MISITYANNLLLDKMTWKLWIYLMINEWTTKEDVGKNRDLVFSLKDELEKSWIKTKYISKEQALKSMPEYRIKALIELWVWNPIPPKLYVTYKNKKQYEIVKNIINKKKYESVIKNINSVNMVSVEKQQEITRKAIDFVSFLKIMFIIFSLGLFVSILWVLLLLIKVNFYSFYTQIEVEKLLWFTYLQITLPFLFYVFVMVSLSFLFSLSYYWILIIKKIAPYFETTFNFNIFQYIDQIKPLIINWLWVEYWLTIFLSFIASYILLWHLIRKV